MERTEIAELLKFWADGKILMSKRSTGLSYAVINKKIADREFLPTTFESLVMTDSYAREQFEKLVAEGRIMDTNLVKLRKDLLTLYAINIACANQELLRFPELGHGCILYID